MSDHHGRLDRLLGGEDLRWLVERVRDRMARGRPVSGVVRRSGATPGERRAVANLFGRRPAGGTSVTVSLTELDALLRSSGACPDGLAAAVEVLTGPVVDRVAARATEAARWDAAYRELDTLPVRRPELVAWRRWLVSTGLVRRLAGDPDRAGRLLADTAAVLARLPSPGEAIGGLAARTCGSAHALDDGRPVGTLVLSAIRAWHGLPETGSADERRSAWAAVGVHLDELSSTVLSVGLPGDAATPAGRALAAARADGEPCLLTLRQLRRTPHLVSVGPLVRICENPIVVAAAADALGPRCPPLVCVNGRPSSATWALLDLLAAAGCRFAYHGDFDWGGIAIAASVHQRLGFTPWRYDTPAYESLLTAAAAPSAAPLPGTPHETPWDPPLSAALHHHATRAEEELALPALLADLTADAPARRS